MRKFILLLLCFSNIFIVHSIAAEERSGILSYYSMAKEITSREIEDMESIIFNYAPRKISNIPENKKILEDIFKSIQNQDIPSLYILDDDTYSCTYIFDYAKKLVLIVNGEDCNTSNTPVKREFLELYDISIQDMKHIDNFFNGLIVDSLSMVFDGTDECMFYKEDIYGKVKLTPDMPTPYNDNAIIISVKKKARILSNHETYKFLQIVKENPAVISEYSESLLFPLERSDDIIQDWLCGFNGYLVYLLDISGKYVPRFRIIDDCSRIHVLEYNSKSKFMTATIIDNLSEKDKDSLRQICNP